MAGLRAYVCYVNEHLVHNFIYAPTHRNILVACIFTTVLATVAVLLRLHQDQAQQQQKGREDLADVHPRAPVSVYESSLHAGARLDMQVLPSESIAALQESCGGDRPHPDSHENEDVTCPGKGRGAVVVESSEKLQKMLGFGGGFTDSATINFFKLPSEVQDKVCVCVCVSLSLSLFLSLPLSLSPSLSLSLRVCIY